jgi:hypothetical protein
MRLPYDVFNAVAEILTEDGPLQSHAMLNFTSKAMREETVVRLYRSMQVREMDDLEYMQGYDLPRG